MSAVFPVPDNAFPSKDSAPGQVDERALASDCVASSSPDVASVSVPSVSGASIAPSRSLAGISPLATDLCARLWTKCITRLKAEVNAHLFSAYVKPLRLASVDLTQKEFVVTSPSLFIRNHVESNFSDILLCVLRQEAQLLFVGASPDEALGTESLGTSDVQGFGVKFLVDPLLRDQQTAGRPAPIIVKKTRSSTAAYERTGQGAHAGGLRRQGYPQQQDSQQREPSAGNFSAGNSSIGSYSGSRRSDPPGLSTVSLHERRIQSGLNPKYTFTNFVVGNNNQFCNAAAQRVAEEPGKSYNPLFIYGGVGLGKTHLLHAIGNAVLDRNPSAQVVYQSSETFTNELIQALRNAKMEEFKRRMRSVDLLLIDDIQFMSGKERTQEEFFHTFNTLYNAKHQIVITSDKVPQDIAGLEERLQTRFAWGLTADLQAPDFETRAAILRRKATIDGFSLPEDVAQFIAEKISSNVRELEGALTRVHAISSLQNIPLSLEAVSAALRPLLQPKQTTISVDDIKKAVAQHFNLKVSEIISKRRTKNLSFPRHIAMYLCRKHTTCSYPEIGGHFGNRDHSSVIHAAGVVSTKVGNDTSVRELVAEIERRLLAR